MSARIDLQIGYTCNNNCIHCFNLDTIISLKNRKLALDKNTNQIKEEIRRSAGKGCGEVVFTGGEATIRKDFFELLEFAKSLGLKASLQTNGRMFSSKEFAERTLKIDPNISFIIPFHHTKPEIFDSITRIKNSYDQTISGIKNLIHFGAKNICLKRILLKQNYKDLENMVKLSSTFGIKQLDFTFVEGGGSARINWFSIAPHYTDIEHYVKKAIDFSNSLKINVTIFDIPFCFLQGYEKHVSEIEYIKKYLNEESDERITISKNENIIKELELKIRKKPKQCKRCKFFNVCFGVWEEYLKFYGSDEFKPIEGKQIIDMKKLESVVKNSR